MAKKKEPEKTYEELMADTEAAVERLESGELPLEESMAEYEKSVANLKKCSQMIVQAQEKLKQYVKKQNGEAELTDFEEEE